MHLFFTANDYSFSYPKDTFDCVVAIAYRKIRRNKRISINKEHGKSRVFKHPRTRRAIAFSERRVYEILNHLGGVPIRQILDHIRQVLNVLEEKCMSVEYIIPPP
jgi:hypothetical protein